MIAAALRPAAAVVKRDLLLAWSYRLRFVTGLFGGFVTVATFYYISRLVRVEEFSPAEYFGFVAIGIIIFDLLTATLTTPHAVLRQELVAGTFERLLLAPRGSVSSIIAMLVFPVFYALLTGFAVLCFAAGVFDLHISWSSLPLALPVAIIGVLAFAPFGILFLAAVVIGKKSPPGASYVVVALSLVAGLYFPVDLLPGWIQWTSEVQPFTPALELLRNTIAGQPLTDPAWVAVLKLVGFAAVALPLSAAVLSAAIRGSRRRGTVLEY
jgi:ABC-2 type transport system permease protein